MALQFSVTEKTVGNAHWMGRINKMIYLSSRTAPKTLITHAPFDVGYDNIFNHKNGDAVIIDTEYKGEPAETCIPKLARYR